MKLEDVAGKKSLSTEEKCIAYLEKMRWPEGVKCPQCGGSGISRFQSKGKTGKVRHLYQCLEKGCRYQFSPTTGTIFHDSHLPLNKWFSAIALVCDGNRDLSVNQLRNELGVQYKTAAHVASRIQHAMEHGTIELHPKDAPDDAGSLAAANLRPAAARGPLPAMVPPQAVRVTAALADRRSATASLLSHVVPKPSSGISATTVDNMLSMFVSLTQLSVKPPLFFVKYIRDKIFT